MRRFDLQYFSHISTIATALVAVLALVIAVWQIKAAENIQREASAREAFKEYLKLAIDKPDFANAQPSDNKSAKSGYEWFVTYFLYSAEQIYTAYPDDPQWHKGLAAEVCYHEVYLQGEEYQKAVKLQHDPEFAAFVDAALKTCATP
ncbi:MAG: hypothetical protein PHE17_20445 [Thiothrix sp.]|uniref:hypothetical protein n=1 Tax=Thiothrix sp. TaxID=1032 RepID=UPI0026289BAB|nr:hypothetical protein [Thiothrix sp.]MDD5395401.1 hypothetical protein [Thiothrix sp.]